MGYITDKINQSIALFLTGGVVGFLPTIEDLNYWTAVGKWVAVWGGILLGLIRFYQGYKEKKKTSEK